jgi:tetratricopeptide (TPR) repeat protein
LYLKGRYFWYQRSAEAFRKAIDCFEAAIAEDPDYARAYVGLADAYALLGDWGTSVVPPKEAFSKSADAVRRALELDDSLAEAHTSLAHIHMHAFRWEDAEREFECAFGLEPNRAATFHWYGLCLAQQGKFDQAIKTMQRAVELDPVSRAIISDFGEVLYFARQPDRAIEQCRKALEMDPDFVNALMIQGLALVQVERHAEAVATFQKAMELSGDRSKLAALGGAYAAAGKKNEALGIIDELKELSGQRYVTPYAFAVIFACLDMSDDTFYWLQKACDEHAADMIYVKVDPFLDNVRSDPRFDALLREVRLGGEPW